MDSKQITVELVGGGSQPLIIKITIPPEVIPKKKSVITFDINFEGKEGVQEGVGDGDSDFVDFEEESPLTSHGKQGISGSDDKSGLSSGLDTLVDNGDFFEPSPFEGN